MTSKEEEAASRERTYIRLYDFETKEFSGLTTYHGLVRIYNSNTWPSRIFWCVVVLSCLSLFMIHSGYLLFSYHSKPTLFQVNTVVPKNGLPFPDVTVCPYNPIDLNKISKWNMTDDLAIFLTHSYIFHSEVDRSELEKFDEDLKLYRDALERNGRKWNLGQFLRDVTPECRDVIKGCSFAGKHLKSCCDHSQTIFTDVGPCIKLKLSSRRQYLSGSAYGLHLLVDGEKKYVNSPQLFQDYGIHVLVSVPEKHMPIRAHGVASPPATTLHAGLHAQNTSYLHRNDWGVCQKQWNTAIHGDQMLSLDYTKDHCEMNAAASAWVKYCSCLPISLAFNQSIEVCSPVDISRCAHLVSEHASVICDVECNILKYDVVHSYGDLSNRTVKSITDQQLKSSALTAVSIYFRSISIEMHEQQKQLQTADLLSNIAGSMGLFLGMSTVTLLEIFIYLFKSVYGTVNTARQKQFRQAMIEEENAINEILVVDNVEPEADDVVGEEPFEAAELGARRISVFHNRRASRMPRNSIIEIVQQPRRSVSAYNRRPSLFVGTMPRPSLAGVLEDVIPQRRGSTAVAIRAAGTRRASIQPPDDLRLSPIRRSSIHPNPMRSQLL